MEWKIFIFKVLESISNLYSKQLQKRLFNLLQKNCSCKVLKKLICHVKRLEEYVFKEKLRPRVNESSVEYVTLAISTSKMPYIVYR